MASRATSRIGLKGSPESATRGHNEIAGMVVHLLALAMMLGAIRILAGKKLVRSWGEAIGFGLGIFSLAVLMHLVGHRHRVDGIGAGGILGEYLAEVMRAAVST